VWEMEMEGGDSEDKRDCWRKGVVVLLFSDDHTLHLSYCLLW
jgi:hypothetical protein